ncbi:MAG: sulfite exporter TauE/SafE family protein [Candidatus Puniceispirillaceae bacterium]
MHTDPLSLSLFVFGCYLIAGTVKGLLGLGLPTTALTILTFLLSPFQALAINLIPMFIANLWQFSRADNIAGLMRRYGYFALSLSVTILAGSFLTSRLSPDVLRLVVAAAVVIFAIYNLSNRPLHLSPDKDIFWQILFGALAGIMGALTSMWAVPLVMYLLSRNLGAQQFVDAAGFLLLVGCLPLSIGYIATGLVTKAVLLPAIMGTIGALAGFQIGETLRGRLNEALFRRLLLWFFLIMGLRMAILALTSL